MLPIQRSNGLYLIMQLVILYLNDAAHSQEDIDALRQGLKGSKGPGNFRTLF